MSDPPALARVRRARRQKERSRAALVQAVRDAHAHGHKYSEIAAVLGVSRQAARLLAERG